MKNLDYKNLDLKELSEVEIKEIQGGTWLAYAVGYLCRWNYEIMASNTESPWNAMGSK
ncbi:hypothetical protein [Parabacteroides sp. Marseille-P3160]|uniref:hypothetical protein n=1 Tax=Parabacteroides sp. Marseille-P3160 TaxID=1917887 RepID=UPI00135A6904|nr:hypothetical protein [Parabacteroides sp. Marseille-P3160]